MIFTPWIALPDHITSSYAFYAALHFLNVVVPSDVLEKLILLSILLLGSFGMHRLIRSLVPWGEKSAWGIGIASIFFVLNPFTYSRFMAGQFAVLLGYSILPWFTKHALSFFKHPGWREALWLGGLATLVGILSIHTLAALAIIMLVGIAVTTWEDRRKLKSVLQYGTIALGICLALSSYWLIPLLMGQGKTATLLNSFTAGDTQAFATVGSNIGVKLFNILRLQGFWAENTGQYLLPREATLLWGLMSLALLIIAVTGAAWLWRRSPVYAHNFALTSCVAIILAAGGIGAWSANVPLLAGLREPHKLVGLFALSYSVFLAFGVDALLTKISPRFWRWTAAIMLLALPFIYMRVMLWGFYGQLTPQHYPADWFTVRQNLLADTSHYQTLFLPWHQYMAFNFTNRIIANPAPAFFGESTTTSTDPEFGAASSGQDSATQQALTSTIASPSSITAQQLANQNIKYIILAKDLDYRKYSELLQQPNLTLLANYPTVQLYQNTSWKEQ